MKYKILKIKNQGLILRPSLLVITLLIVAFTYMNPVYAIDLNQQLFDSISQRNLIGVEQALQGHADINTHRTKGLSSETPLLLAIRTGEREIVELLLKHGADVVIHHGTLNNSTMLSVAIDQGGNEIVALLIKYGVDINEQSGFWHNYSPLYSATTHGNLIMVKLLINAGAKIIPNRWTYIKEILITPWDIVTGKVVDLGRPPSLLEAAERSGNDELYQLLKANGAR